MKWLIEIEPKSAGAINIIFDNYCLIYGARNNTKHTRKGQEKKGKKKGTKRTYKEERQQVWEELK